MVQLPSLRLLAKPAFGLALASTLAMAAGAQPSLFGHIGSWLIYGGSDDRGRVCGMAANEGGGFLTLRVYDGGILHIVAGSETWRLPATAEMKIEVLLGRETPWSFIAESLHRETEAMVRWNVTGLAVPRFLGEIRRATGVVINFPTERPWRAPLTGGKQAVDALSRCVRESLPGMAWAVGEPPPPPYVPGAPLRPGSR